MKDALNPQTFGDLDEHRGVFEIDDLLDWRLGDVQRKPKDVRVGFSEVNKAGGNKEIYEHVQLDLLNPIRIQSASCPRKGNAACLHRVRPIRAER
jgi:hypothetical protein